MTTRELWLAIMHYGEFDRVPVIHWTGWPETRERWIREGMPPDADERKFFDAVPQWTGAGVNLDIYPLFEEETLEDTAEYRIFRDHYGVVQQDWKNSSCIPHYTGFTLKTGKDWDAYKKRLQPCPERIPDDLDDRIRDSETSGLPVVISTASMMGWIRNWMGVVNMSYLTCEEPDVFADMVDTIADLVCWGMDQVIPRMSAPPDMGFGWEDICGKNGPLVGPDTFRRCVAPGYRKVRARLEHYGVPLYGIDTDGHIAPLVKDWLEAGVNVQFPIEIGTWKADPMQFRKRYGKDLRIIGGFDKLELEKGPAAIDAEIDRRLPLMRDGGYVPMPDHLITPGVSLKDYQYYLERMRDLRL
jgi:Uroporphyrinogen decarboxylase (URO-D)